MATSILELSPDSSFSETTVVFVKSLHLFWIWEPTRSSHRLLPTQEGFTSTAKLPAYPYLQDMEGVRLESSTLFKGNIQAKWG